MALKGELGEGVYILSNVNVIGVGVISLIRNVLDSTEALLIYSGKAIAEGFCGSAVKTEAKSRFLLPLLAG